MNIADLSCIGDNGRPLHGTAAILHRMFSKSEVATNDDKEREMNEYRAIIKKCKYAYFDD